ncbi:MAG: glycosyltransferase family 4 protein [Candidatus Altiarchaeota archaeon]
MRIIFSAQNFRNDVGGAEISAQTLLKRLAEKHEVHVVSRGSKGVYEWNGIKVHEVSCPNNILYINLFWSRYLDGLGFKPDLIITQVNAAAPTVFWCKRKRVPCLFYIRSFEHFCLDSFKHRNVFECNHNCWKCEGVRGLFLHPAYQLIYSRNREAIRSADMVIAQTDFMRKVVEHYTGRVCDVVPNLMDLESCRVEEHGDAVLFVNPTKHKGVELVSKLVKRLRGRKFVLAGKVDKDVQWLTKEENVEYLGFVEDMREAYSKSRIVIVPSDMADSSPRIIPEAMVSGIPCIVSDVGGASEMGGDAAVKVAADDVDKWAEEINKLYEDEEYYQRLSILSKRHASSYTLQNSFNALNELVEKRLRLRL